MFNERRSGSTFSSKFRIGFTTLELMIGLGISALTVVVAVPLVGIFTHRNQCMAAARELASTADFARSRAQDTGRVATLWINGTAQCAAPPAAQSAVAWAVTVNGQAVADRCLTSTDYIGRYGNTHMAAAAESLRYLPIGIADSPIPALADANAPLQVVFSSTDAHRQVSTVSIYPGGSTHVDSVQS